MTILSWHVPRLLTNAYKMHVWSKNHKVNIHVDILHVNKHIVYTRTLCAPNLKTALPLEKNYAFEKLCPLFFFIAYVYSYCLCLSITAGLRTGALLIEPRTRT